MNILMISIGDNILSSPVGDTLKRQEEYAKALGYIDMIVFSPKKHNLKTKHFKNLSIYPTKSANILTFVYDVLRIAKEIMQKRSIDVITTQDPFGTALAGYLLKRRCGASLHVQNHSCFLDNQQWISEKPVLFTLFNMLSHFCIKKADRLRVVNHQEKQKYIKILGIDEKKIDVAPVPVNIEFWQIQPTQSEIEKFIKKYNIDIAKPILSWAGRMVRVKNLPYLFKSISLVCEKHDVNFLIAGDIENSHWDLRLLEEKYSAKPIYLGLLNHEELRVLYYLTKVYLHTSDYEGFGLVVSDAQACGVVVVSRDTAGARDIIEDAKSGFLVKGDEREFSSKVVELLEDNQKLAELSNYAKKMLSKKFDRNNMFDKVINSIKKAKFDR